MPNISSNLDLNLAWQRTKKYRQDRAFVINPFIDKWIEHDLPRWLNAISTRLNSGYSPREGLPCFMPKPKGMLRKGIILDIRDEVVFTSLLGNFHEEIWKKVSWSQGSPDMAYQLAKPNGAIEWTGNRLTNWKEWTTNSIELLEMGNRYVLFTDIVNFYDNIDLRLLESHLRELHLNADLVNLLMDCLRRWSIPNGKGIPQGYTASDLLSKLYLNSIDRALKNTGLEHLRYVDDIRIFCRSKHDARKALAELTMRLVQKGLALNAEKTEILPVDQARGKIIGASGVINTLQEDMKNAMALGKYVTEAQIEEEFTKNPSNVPKTIFETLFNERFTLSGVEFDKTLFHYLLSRLGAVKSNIAVNYCIQMIIDSPDEMDYVLKYLKNIAISTNDFNAILSFMASSEAIYDFQLYQIVRWFLQIKKYPDSLLALCRQWAFNRNREACLRSYSLLALGIAGNEADLEKIQECYNTASTKCEKAEIATCLARMEKTRRNRFYSNIKNDSALISQAIEVVKQNDAILESL